MEIGCPKNFKIWRPRFTGWQRNILSVSSLICARCVLNPKISIGDTSLCNASGSKANNLAPRPRQAGCFYGQATPFQKYFHSKVGDDVYCVRTRVSCKKETCLLGNGWNYLAMTKTDLEKRLKIYKDNPDLLAISFEEFHYCLGDFCNAPTESSETSFSKNDKNSNGIIRGPDLNSNRLSRGTFGIENINFNDNTGLNRLLSGGAFYQKLSVWSWRLFFYCSWFNFFWRRESHIN